MRAANLEELKEYAAMKAVPDRLVTMNRKLIEMMSLVRLRFAFSNFCSLLILFVGSLIPVDNPIFFYKYYN